jgi:predicted Zn finger-like uncharacterized protein
MPDQSAMIVTCPACKTRYQVADAALGGAEGRRVRCASCGNLWHYSPEAAAREATAEATAAAEAAAVATAATAAPSKVEPLRAERRTDVTYPPAGPTPTPPPSRAAEVILPEAARRRRSRAFTLGLVLFLAAILVSAILAREPIMQLWPQTVPVYSALRLAETPGAGLEVSVTPSRTADALAIDGEIVNTAGAARRVPKLRVALRDGNKVEIDAKVIDPPVEELAAGARTRFNTTFRNPSITATGVAVTFAGQ